jgi:uncharacterized membrane protein YgcG
LFDCKDSRLKQAIEEAERVAVLFAFLYSVGLLLVVVVCFFFFFFFFEAVVVVCWVALFVFSLWEFVPVFTGGLVIVLSLVYKRFNSSKKKEEEGGGGGWRTADHASQQKNEKWKARERGKEEGDKVHSSSPGTR